ncbi:uncharacterized protein LOC105423543 [Pogonomyrmex barbatus]|uniref:Uncharacterized protein LOC105423543 n=1 Tax=Pogonomyrmex barbatus TaxID=144034 RepID=A0A6I9VX54_9HYME|nr:uncharacterized protein LOC105423543 [Pogonomyrmex barbatus]
MARHEKARERITAGDSIFDERTAATTVWAAMKAKTKLGMDLKKKKRKILPTAKRGGLLPTFPILGVLSSLIGSAASVAKAMNAGKAARRQLEELQRHTRTMKGHGLHLAPYKRGSGVIKERKKNHGRKH